MFYHKNFRKYFAFRSQTLQRDEDVEGYIVNLRVTTQALYEELRRRFPRFYHSKI